MTTLCKEKNKYKIIRKINIEQLRNAPVGTRVLVKCVGKGWTLPVNMLTSINICKEDGLYLEANDTFNFEYDYPYDKLGLQVECSIITK